MYKNKAALFYLNPGLLLTALLCCSPAINAAELSRARYDGGQTAYLEVLDTERSMFNAELESSAVKGALLSSYLYLYKALGGGWITPAEEATSQ